MLNEEFLERLRIKGLVHRYSNYKYEGTEYERKHTVELVPVPEEVADDAKFLQHELAEYIEGSYETLRKAQEMGLRAYFPCCEGSFDQPEPEKLIAYTETEEEWIARCEALDAE